MLETMKAIYSIVTAQLYKTQDKIFPLLILLHFEMPQPLLKFCIVLPLILYTDNCMSLLFGYTSELTRNITLQGLALLTNNILSVSPHPL